MNEEKPTLFYTEFVVEEGGSLVVDLPKLYAEDGDVPEDELIFTITEPPINGRFLNLVRNSFLSNKSIVQIFLSCDVKKCMGQLIKQLRKSKSECAI